MRNEFWFDSINNIRENLLLLKVRTEAEEPKATKAAHTAAVRAYCRHFGQRS